MKKIIIVLILIMGITGCSLREIDNTPTKQVEKLFNNYQTLNEKVLDDLNLVIAKETNFTSKQKDKYKEILKKHYQNLTYEIKDETVNGDEAIVDVEIEVTDFYKALNEFSNENIEDYIDNKLNTMEEAKDRVKYTLYIKVHKDENGIWTLEELSNDDEQKILGMYRY